MAEGKLGESVLVVDWIPELERRTFLRQKALQRALNQQQVIRNKFYRYPAIG